MAGAYIHFSRVIQLDTLSVLPQGKETWYRYIVINITLLVLSNICKDYKQKL